MDLQELITRGRLLFSGAPTRLELFKEVDGKHTAKEIAAKLNRHVNSVRRDLTTIRDVGLIQEKLDGEGNPLKRGRFPIYEKIPLARTVSVTYFQSVGRRPDTSQSVRALATTRKRARGASKLQPLKLPSAREILDICKHGEDQIYEFKGQGTDVRKITKEIAGMLHTRQGGVIFYGVEDDGTIEGSDMSRQAFDQAIQNSVRNTIAPAATVKLNEVTVLGSKLLVIISPPWNKKDVYQYEGRVYIRKGTNVFVARPEESKKLHQGQYVV